jgi:O-methyltransferase domain
VTAGGSSRFGRCAPAATRHVPIDLILPPTNSKFPTARYPQGMTPVETPRIAPDAEAMQQVFQLGMGFIVSAALGSAIQFDIPDHLGDGPRATADLARTTGTDEGALYRLLRALATVGVFEETTPRTFALTSVGHLLRRGAPGGAREMVLWMCDAFHYRVYAEMPEAIRSGHAVGEKVVGMPVFEYLARDRALAERFNNAMTAFSGTVAPAVLDAYDFSGINVLVDIAGGHGMVLASILRKYPQMRGILFDLEHVLSGNRLQEFGVQSRVQTVAGDFFREVPPGGDAYIMKHIIHDWDDEKALVILKNIRAALAQTSQGRVILLETVVLPGNQPDMGKLIDLEMLLLPGGKERTAEEFASLFDRAGFALTRIVATQSPLSVVEARPK